MSILTAQEVAGRISTISAFYDISSKDSFFKMLEMRLSKLQGLYNEFSGLEAEAYAKMGCRNLNDLQQKINEINSSGLINFSARALSVTPVMKEATGTQITNQQRTEIINQNLQSDVFSSSSFLHPATQEIVQESVNYFADQGVQQVFSSLAQFVKTSRSERGEGFQMSAFAKQFEVSGGRLKLTKMSDSYKKDFKLLVSATNTQATPQHLGFNVQIDWVDTYKQMKAQSAQLNAYPYYNLTPDQYKKAMSDDSLWAAFKYKVASLAPKYISQIASAMDQIGRQAFFSNSPAQIQGILGELGAMVMLKILCPSKQVAYTGATLNQYKSFKGQQLGVDVFLEDIGFQIKNYKGYGFGSSPTGINLKGQYNLPTFAEKIEGINKNDLIDAKVFQYFHIQVDPDFSAIRGLIESINNNFEYAYIGSINNFMPFQQIVQLTEDGPVETHRNLFYLIGGTQVVASSSIILAYIKQLEGVLQTLELSKKGAGSAFSVTSSYGGPTYADYIKSKSKEKFSYGSIANGITMSYNINIHIPNLNISI